MAPFTVTVLRLDSDVVSPGVDADFSVWLHAVIHSDKQKRLTYSRGFMRLDLVLSVFIVNESICIDNEQYVLDQILRLRQLTLSSIRGRSTISASEC